MTEEQMELVMDSNEQLAFELFDINEMELYHRIAKTLQQMVRDGKYKATKDNIKFYGALRRYRPDDEQVHEYYKAMYRV